jgi:hypothetical protein
VWIHLAQGSVAGFSEHSNEHFCSIKDVIRRSTTRAESWLPSGGSSNLLYLNVSCTTLSPIILASVLTSS